MHLVLYYFVVTLVLTPASLYTLQFFRVQMNESLLRDVDIAKKNYRYYSSLFMANYL